MNESLLNKLKMVRARDIGHVFLFLLALLPALVYRRLRPHLWLVCESGAEARDNGYWFFKYLREQRPEIDAVYAIDPKSREYARVAALGETVAFGSFRHWILYLAAEVNISSQKYGKPNAAVCYVLEVVLGWLKNRRVFLQHGVIKDDLPFLHEEKARFWLFACGAEPEYRFVRDSFGYGEGVVRYLGLCRFDALHGLDTDEELILILPTWRMYLQRGGDRESFCNSEYYRSWSALLRDGALSELLARENRRAVFVLHREMEAFEDLFGSEAENIRVLRWQEADITALIHSAALLITDYSSVYMDFAYMKKPVLYYQFDYERFRSGHLPKGYFEYERDGFGPVCPTEEELLAQLARSLRGGTKMDEVYQRRVERFYVLHDAKNSERTARAIEEKLAQEKARSAK